MADVRGEGALYPPEMSASYALGFRSPDSHWPVTGCACSELDRDGEAGVSQSWKPVSKTIRKS